jgi:hypothetical protein
MHCRPLIGPAHRSMDDMHSSFPASAARRDPGSKKRDLAVGDLPGGDVAVKSQRSHYKWVSVVNVIRSPGSCWRCSACLFFPSSKVASAD